MRRSVLMYLLAVMAVCPATASSQDARSILETVQQKQLERWEGVNDYLVTVAIMGHATDMYFQRTEVKGEDGVAQTFFLPISSNQRTTGSCTTGAVQMTADDLEAFAMAQEMTGAGLGEEIENGLESAGLPRGLLAASGSDPTATFDPRVMMNSNATFLRGAAEAKRQQAQEGARNIANAEESASQQSQFMNSARLVGTETIDGRSAYHLLSDTAQVQQGENGEQFVMEVMNIWIDAKDYVPLRMKIDGTMTSGNETRPMTIETLMSDYRAVPGSKMYESYKQTVRLAGMMDAEQEAQMREAAQQMAEFEKQMASMPPSQRQMMENMMGPQMEAMRSMASGGGFQTEKIIRSIQVNPPMVAEDGSPCPSGSAAVVAVERDNSSGSSTEILTRSMIEMIQNDLTTLGYAPGPVTGELNKETAIAISKFQAAKGMEVTGQPTPQLAGILSATADAQNK